MAVDKSLHTNQQIMIAEKRILNSVFQNPQLLDGAGLSSDLMLHGNCINILKSMERLHEKGFSFTKQSVYQEVSGIDIDIEFNLIEDIFDGSGEQQVDDAIKLLKKARGRREAILKLAAIEKIIDSSAIEDSAADEKIREGIDEALMAFSYDPDDISRVYTMEEWLDVYEIEREPRRSGKQYPFNNFLFDNLIPDGASPGTIGILAASSGSGKSTIALNLMNSLIETDIPVMMFSLEMALIPTADRLISMRTGIPYSEIANPRDSSSYDSITPVIKEQRSFLDSKKRFRICENASLSLKDIEKHIRKFQADIGQSYGIIIIDLLSMVKEFSQAKSGMNYADSVTIAINQLSAITKSLRVHILGIVQLNRSAESEKADDWEDCLKFRPQRSQIKSAGAYVERSRYVLGAFRQMFWAEQFLSDDLLAEIKTEHQDFCEVSVLKINNGETGKKIDSLFDGEIFNLTPIENSISGGGGGGDDRGIEV
jgi:replicative DNA helicase